MTDHATMEAPEHPGQNRNVWEIMRDLATTVGLPPWSVDPVQVHGQDPIEPSPIRIGDGASAVLGTLGAAVGRLWQGCGGREQRIELDCGAACLATRAVTFGRQNGAVVPKPEPTYPLTQFYQAGDGRWLFLHGGFPKLRNGLLDLLNCPNSEEAIARAVADWEGRALEEAIIERELVGTLVRSRQEWEQTEQYRVMAPQPVVSITRIGDAPPIPLNQKGNRPLSDIRVVDVTHVLAGPTCSRTLASFGADVIHVTFPTHPDIHVFDMDTGHGKRAVNLDLYQKPHQEALERLCRGTDVFVESYRPGILPCTGFSPERVAEMRPGSIYVSVKCFGHAFDGPWGNRPGFEQIAQSVSGLVVSQTEALSKPTPIMLPTYPNDYVVGYLGALGAVMGLMRRAEEGGSYLVQVSLVHTAMWLQSLGYVDPADALLPDVAAEDRYVRPYLMNDDGGPFGRLIFLGPVLRMSETPAYWSRSTVPLGSDLPRW